MANPFDTLNSTQSSTGSGQDTLLIVILLVGMLFFLLRNMAKFSNSGLKVRVPACPCCCVTAMVSQGLRGVSEAAQLPRLTGDPMWVEVDLEKAQPRGKPLRLLYRTAPPLHLASMRRTGLDRGVDAPQPQPCVHGHGNRRASLGLWLGWADGGNEGHARVRATSVHCLCLQHEAWQHSLHAQRRPARGPQTALTPD